MWNKEYCQDMIIFLKNVIQMVTQRNIDGKLDIMPFRSCI